MGLADSPSTPNDTKQSLRYMQIAALGAILLIAAIIYTFSHIPIPSPPTVLPKIVVTPPYRQKMPQFEWSNGASRLKSSDFLGGWTLLSFWSYTCAPCLEEMPDLDQFTENWSGPEMSLVTINEDAANPEMSEAIQQFLADNEIQLPVDYDPDGRLKTIFGVTEIPHHFLISPSGDIVWQARGAFDWQSPESAKSLLTFMERERALAPDAKGP